MNTIKRFENRFRDYVKRCLSDFKLNEYLLKQEINGHVYKLLQDYRETVIKQPIEKFFKIRIKNKNLIIKAEDNSLNKLILDNFIKNITNINIKEISNG